MSSEVFANGNAVACKAGDGKVIAAFPDVCLSPPSPPAGPIPVPYPNTSFSKDMQNGSKTVKINGKEVMLKDKSFYKTSPLGDEAATRSFGASVVTHVITGKTYFKAWSTDVKFEGENIPRHMDITGSNHASEPSSPPPQIELEIATVKEGGDKCPTCKKARGEQQTDKTKSYDEFFSYSERAELDQIAADNPDLTAMLPPKNGRFTVLSKRNRDGAYERYEKAKKNKRMKGDYHHPHPLKTGGCPIHQELVKKPDQEPDKSRVDAVDTKIQNVVNKAIERNG
jgi:hypothetical protein